jgi:hypothetical protein
VGRNPDDRSRPLRHASVEDSFGSRATVPALEHYGR